MAPNGSGIFVDHCEQECPYYFSTVPLQGWHISLERHVWGDVGSLEKVVPLVQNVIKKWLQINLGFFVQFLFAVTGVLVLKKKVARLFSHSKVCHKAGISQWRIIAVAKNKIT